MNLNVFLVYIGAVIFAVEVTAIHFDKVEPFKQPEPVTISEKAGVKFKPKLYIEDGCDSFPAVNAAGETSEGLGGAIWSSDKACKGTFQGSQVYGRASWYNDKFAIMYTWYFPKSSWAVWSTHRHDWSSLVVWIDNPELETPTMLGLSFSKTDTKYDKQAPLPPGNTVTTPTILRSTQVFSGPPYLSETIIQGDFQDLIMWDQLTDAARKALNTTDFGSVKVPFIDENFQKKLEQAWPFER